MKADSIPESNAHEVIADKRYGQLLIQTSSPSNTLADAIEIIGTLGVHVLEKRFLADDLALLKLDVKDVRDLALKLIERGFPGIQGYNACLSRRERAR